MSKSLVPRDPDPATGVIKSVAHDGVTVGVVIGAIVVHAIPFVGWLAYPVAGGVLAVRAWRNGRKRRQG